MVSRFRYLLLPAFGGIAALAAFKIAAPYEATLNRPDFSLSRPETLFTVGTQWGDVNRIAFGALLGCLFCLGLTLGRRAWYQILTSTILGALLGGAVNFITDSTADIIGREIAMKEGMVGNIVATAAWCVLVPLGLSFVLLFALGPTVQRLRRAIVGSVWAAVAAAAAQMAGELFATKEVAQITAGAIAGNSAQLSAFIPVWRAQELAVGIALGIAMAMADSRIRVGTLRLLLGRNEQKEWSLDYTVSRVGSAEGIEIPLGPIAGLEKVHAVITRQADRFVMDTHGRPAQVNGVSMTTRDLLSGDTIQLGSAKLQFVSGVVTAAPRPVAFPTPQVAYPPAAVPVAATPLGILIDPIGGQYRLPPGQYGVGREPDNAICLAQGPNVAPYHAQIIVTPLSLLLVAGAASPGTFVNGVPVTGQTALRAGDQLRFGDVNIRVDRVPGNAP